MSIKMLLFIAFLASKPTVENAYVERDGIVVMEAEAPGYEESWVLETSYEGYSGSGYLTWKDENRFDKPGDAAISYHVFVHNPGMYYLQLRNFNNDPDPTECNDLFVRINENDWIKTYSHINLKWNWHTGFDLQHVWGLLPKFELSAGLNTIQLSGRSHGFSIDRLALVIPEKLAMDSWKTQEESELIEITSNEIKTH